MPSAVPSADVSTAVHLSALDILKISLAVPAASFRASEECLHVREASLWHSAACDLK